MSVEYEAPSATARSSSVHLVMNYDVHGVLWDSCSNVYSSDRSNKYISLQHFCPTILRLYQTHPLKGAIVWKRTMRSL